MKCAGRNKQYVVGLDHTVLGVDGGALDQRQQIALYALAGHIGPLTLGMPNNFVYFIQKDNAVLLYMKGTPDFPQCGFSGQTVAALNAIGKPYAFVNIFEDEEIRQGLKEYSNWPTFPQLYVKGELIGGSDIVVEMYHSGELKELLEGDASE